MRSIIIVTCFLLAGCGSQCNEPLFFYEPTVFDGDCFIRVESLMTERHFDRVEKVLAFYEIRYERKNARSIQLKEGILPELIFNYGSKAENDAWLKERRLQ